MIGSARIHVLISITFDDFGRSVIEFGSIDNNNAASFKHIYMKCLTKLEEKYKKTYREGIYSEAKQ